MLSSNTIAQIYDLFHFDRRNFFAAKLHSHRQAHYLATPSTRFIAMGTRIMWESPTLVRHGKRAQLGGRAAGCRSA